MNVEGVEKKATAAALRAARQIVDLQTNEVSIVDRPAIRRKFLVVKRLEDPNMGEKKDSGTTEISQQVSKMLLDGGFTLVEKSLPDTLKNDATATAQWMVEIAQKAEGESKERLLRTSAMLQSMGNGKVPGLVTKAEPPPPKKGEKAEDEDEEETKPTKKAPKQKAVSLDEEDDSVAIIKMDAKGNVHLVSKGQKQLTSNRISSLSEAAKQVLGLLKEADEETFKSTIAALTEKDLPHGTPPASAVRPVSVGTVETPRSVTKAEEDRTEVLLKRFEEVTKRLDAIEKMRSPSTAVLDDQAKPPTTTETKKSFWTGVL